MEHLIDVVTSNVLFYLEHNWYKLISLSLSLTGFYLISNKDVKGAIVWAIASLCWCIICIFGKDYELAVLYSIYFFAELWVIYKWSKKSE